VRERNKDYYLIFSLLVIMFITSYSSLYVRLVVGKVLWILLQIHKSCKTRESYLKFFISIPWILDNTCSNLSMRIELFVLHFIIFTYYKMYPRSPGLSLANTKVPYTLASNRLLRIRSEHPGKSVPERACIWARL
jgi:hypothetical protein